MNIESVAPGQTFTYLGVEYKMLRLTGEVDAPNINQWGRRTGGTHRAVRAAVKVNRHHRGWQFSYVAFRANAPVVVR